MTRNEVRTAQTRDRLVSAARALFARDGFARTGTEAILADAGVRRGALYHHYRDKADLFDAVCRQFAAEAADAVRRASAEATGPLDALERGSIGWIDFMARPDSRRVLVLDAPGVLGRERWEALDRELSFDLLQTGVAAAIEAGEIGFAGPPAVLAALLNGAMNEIALRGRDEDIDALKAGYIALLRALKR